MKYQRVEAVSESMREEEEKRLREEEEQRRRVEWYLKNEGKVMIVQRFVRKRRFGKVYLRRALD